MIVECPNCSSSFNLDASLVPPKGRKVRCSVCEHVFDVRPEAKAAPRAAEPDDLEESFGEDFGADDEDLLGALGDAEEEEEAPAPKARRDEGRGAGGDSGPSLSLNLDAPGKKEKGGSSKGKRIGLIAASVVLLVGAALGAVWFFAPQMLGLPPKAETTAQTPEAAMDMAEQVKKISLESIKQYYVENDKAGRLFVIQGKAVNLFETPKELIEIEASLFDADNNELTTQRIKCGNTLDLFQLQVLGEQEILEALKNEAGIGANNINIQPGKSVPFMVVFFAPPDNLAEFNVKVVAARNVDL